MGVWISVSWSKSWSKSFGYASKCARWGSAIRPKCAGVWVDAEGSCAAHPFWKNSSRFPFAWRKNKVCHYTLPKYPVSLDPGIGFGKTVPQSLELLNRLDEICALGFPVLIGPSRKSFIGHILKGIPAEKRLAGSLAATTWALIKGAAVVRTHDVQETKDLIRVAQAIKWEDAEMPGC